MDSPASRTERWRLKQRRKRQSLENEGEESRLKPAKVNACNNSIGFLHKLHSRTVRKYGEVCDYPDETGNILDTI